MKRIKRIIIFATAGLFILAIGYVSCSRSGTFQVVSVTSGPFHIKVHAVGRLQSSKSCYITPPPVEYLWNFVISNMTPEGKEVRQGDVILSFDPRQLTDRVRTRQTEMESAKKELEKIRLVEQEAMDSLQLQFAELRMLKQKTDQKANQPEEYIQLNELKKSRMDAELANMKVQLIRERIKNQESGMKTRINVQIQKIKRLERELVVINKEIAALDVKAPMNGIVVYYPDYDGKKKAPGDQCWMGSIIMELPDLTQMEILSAIPESEANKVKVGLKTEIRLDSNPDRVYRGIVKSLGRIFRIKTDDQPAVVFDAIITLKNPDPQSMRPGMAASVDIIIASRDHVLSIPESALIFHEGRVFVRKKTFLGKTLVPIQIGIQSGGMVEVKEGLKPRDRVAIPLKKKEVNND